MNLIFSEVTPESALLEAGWLQDKDKWWYHPDKPSLNYRRAEDVILFEWREAERRATSRQQSLDRLQPLLDTYRVCFWVVVVVVVLTVIVIEGAR